MGTFGIVLKGKNQSTQQIVAIKIQQEMKENEKEMLNKMKGKEFRNLIKIFEIEQIDNYYYIVMEYCTESLYDRIKSKGTINPDQIRFIMKEIGNGLKEIHDLGYAHRDMKPENVLIFQKKDLNGTTQELYKICDFGTIKDVDVLQTQAIGTAYYLAPEQLIKTNQGSSYTSKVDIWAFGAMIYELMTNIPLFDGYSEEEVYQKILSTTQEQIDEKINTNLRLERKYKTLLLNMLQIDTNKRYDIHQVQSDLRGQSQNVTRNQVPNSRISQIISGQQNSGQQISNLVPKKYPIFDLPIPMPTKTLQNFQKTEILPAPQQLKEKQQQMNININNQTQNKVSSQMNYACNIPPKNSSMQKFDQPQPKFQGNQPSNIGKSIQINPFSIKANMELEQKQPSSLAQDQIVQKQQVPPQQQIPQNTQQITKVRFNSTISNSFQEKNPQKQGNNFGNINQSQPLSIDGPKQNFTQNRNSSTQPQTQPIFQLNQSMKLNQQQNYFQNFAPRQDRFNPSKFTQQLS
ncbi:unnamed protein product (macronuclear) [Paramecium tetraurelia]|uniref:Protein kinase domain-containing protein n=1 Tax=Paramecium tetraurelia TaxID=5888 RepID=A0ED05_PARTE|nr:uncharacterized protein GSPATT00004041001 [Paramecium tetraurelia]CAK93172.1 unnamed protein product [Paramecium tetraurelia]|eukprot:XP_001460569.1 hypothetical protein (macronuclear) [Paramecium tetraurelia strain d4-2]